MGVTLKKKEYSAIANRIHQGIIILERRQYVPADAAELNLGVLLGTRLLEYKNAVTGEIVCDELKKLFSGANKKIYITNPEILFTAEYKVDVISALLQAGRNRCLYLVWPGKIDSDALVYAEPEYTDYCKYEVRNYIDTYIVVR